MPEHVTAVVLEQLPSITCSPEELQAAVQHPSVTRLLLQHVQQQLESAEGGDSTDTRMWEIHALQEVFVEAARLGDVPLLDYFALRVQRREQRRLQRDLQWQAQQQQQQQQGQPEPPLQPVQQARWQDSRAADWIGELGILAAVQNGSLATLQLVVPPAAGQTASPAQELLRLVYREPRAVRQCIFGAVKQREPAAVQLLLAGYPQLPDEEGHLLRCSLKPYQPAMFHMLLEHCGLPTEPFRMEQLVEDACSADAPDALRPLLERSGLLPNNIQLLKAVEVASLGCVQALLAAAGGPLEVPVPPGGLSLAPAAEPWRAGYECPVLAVLLQNLNPAQAANSRKLLRIMEALQAAGYRPTVYENVRVWLGAAEPLVARFDPLAEDPAFDLQGVNRHLWLALERPDWSPVQHRRFPPRFRRAVQTLLLAAHGGRGTQSSGGSAGDGDDSTSGSAQLQHLPPDLLLRIVGHAAYPLSAWAPGTQV